ncbi:MAG: bestrophin family protein [Vogesella sp.]|uniref:bestrophin family protein n=1 Tax=Vogesella sp. TaxID=1904252 RepID=UPI003F34AEAD
MIVLPRYNWLRLLFVWHGSVLPRIVSRLAIVFALSLLSAVLDGWWLSQHADSALNVSIFTLMGVSLAIFLGFRNSASYERFWEARKLWGGLLIVSRSLTGKLQPVAAPQGRPMLYAVCALTYALKGQLRDDDIHPHLVRLLPADLAEQLRSGRNVPARLLAWLHAQNHQLLRDGHLSEQQWLSVDCNLDTLGEVIGGCERIRNTPIPFTYRVLLNRTVTGYCLLLPLGLVTTIGWLTPIIAVFIAYTYLALDSLGDELEEPFGKEGNDLPLSALCYGIEQSVRDMLGEAMPVEPPPRQGIYQF